MLPKGILGKRRSHKPLTRVSCCKLQLIFAKIYREIWPMTAVLREKFYVLVVWKFSLMVNYHEWYSVAKVDPHQIDPELNVCYENIKPEYVAQTFFLIFMTIATIVGNTAICCSIYHNQTLHRFSNYLVVSLALSDLMVAFFSLPMRIHQSLHNTNWCLDENTCVMWIWADLACRCTCFANLTLISVVDFTTGQIRAFQLLLSTIL